MKRVYKLLATLGSVLALVGLFATMAFSAPDQSEPLDEDPDDNADRETVEVLADRILLVDVRASDSSSTNQDDLDGLNHVFGLGNLNSADAFGPDTDAAAGDRYFEYKEEAVIDITANTDDWTLEVCNGGSPQAGFQPPSERTGNSVGFTQFTESDGSGSFLALKTLATNSTENNTIIAQGPNAKANHPTWAYLNEGSGNSPELPGHNPEDGTDCDGSQQFTYTGPEPSTGSTADNKRDGIADEDFTGPFASKGIPFEYVIGYDANDGTFGDVVEGEATDPDTTTVLWTITSGELAND